MVSDTTAVQLLDSESDSDLKRQWLWEVMLMQLRPDAAGQHRQQGLGQQSTPNPGPVEAPTVTQLLGLRLGCAGHSDI